MPLFSSNKFLPKKTPQRKIGYNFPKRKLGEDDEFKFEIEKIQLNIGEQNAVFEDGEWVPENGVSGQRVKEHQRLKQQLQQLDTENNFLKLKNEVLLDMDPKKLRQKRQALKNLHLPDNSVPAKIAHRSGRCKSEDKKQDEENKLKAQEIFEKTFPELKAKRESRERFEKIRHRCKSEADVEEVLKLLNEEAQMKRNAAVIPPLLTEPSQCHENCLCHQSERLDEKNNFGIKCEEVLDSFTNTNKRFTKSFKKYPKNFGKIAARLNRSVKDCIYYYYLTKKKINKFIDYYCKKLKSIHEGLSNKSPRRMKYMKTVEKIKPNH